MSVLTRLFGRAEHAAATEDVVCPHKALIPRWDSIEDMGKIERATSFHCEACGADFSGDEGRRISAI